MNLTTVRAYLLGEQSRKLWDCRMPFWAGRFPGQWIHAAMVSKINPMTELSRTLVPHRELILNSGKKAVYQWQRRWA